MDGCLYCPLPGRIIPTVIWQLFPRFTLSESRIAPLELSTTSSACFVLLACMVFFLVFLFRVTVRSLSSCFHHTVLSLPR